MAWQSELLAWTINGRTVVRMSTTFQGALDALAKSEKVHRACVPAMEAICNAAPPGFVDGSWDVIQLDFDFRNGHVVTLTAMSSTRRLTAKAVRRNDYDDYTVELPPALFAETPVCLWTLPKWPRSEERCPVTDENGDAVTWSVSLLSRTPGGHKTPHSLGVPSLDENDAATAIWQAYPSALQRVVIGRPGDLIPDGV